MTESEAREAIAKIDQSRKLMNRLSRLFQEPDLIFRDDVFERVYYSEGDYDATRVEKVVDGMHRAVKPVLQHWIDLLRLEIEKLQENFR